ncbi:hypothetical protein ACFOMD_17285 [Sphingoaurantiacus capsulatus]|uniref:Uncharacterized protein n=1 Tax=Sphingoaurantiacus capsulatus TaxID=1771310 RepID=A0ABV7XEV2_9SPHN
MLSLRNGAAVSRALSSDIDPELRALIARRVDQLQGYGAEDIGELVHFLVVEPGDTVEAVRAELGFSPLVNFVDGSRYGEPGWTPSWEVAEQHGDWFEIVFVLSDDGFGWVMWFPATFAHFFS